jgi:signal transduction histidine kinase
MILTLLGAFILGLVIIRIVTNNFSRIIDVMDKFRQGDMSARVHVRGKGDIKQLANIFNEMADILTRNMEKLKEVEVLRRELIANVSHDLRTPISIIHGYVETLQMKEDTLSLVDRRRYLNIIIESTAGLEKLVNELFELSKLEANQVQPQMEPFFISELLSDMTNKYQLIAEHKNIVIETLLAKELPLVYADISLIERVMQNLMDNAIRFTPNGGKVLIKTKSSNSKVEVTVADSGVGIAEDDREKIFGRYHKAGTSGNFKNSTGLGLAIVKKILDLHQCSLFIHDNLPEGAAFVFYLPVYKK